MCRLLTSEISTVVESVASVQIDTLARELCEMPAEDLNVIDVSTVRSRYEQTTFIGAGGFGSLLADCPMCNDRCLREHMEPMLVCDHMMCTPCIRRQYSSFIPLIRDQNCLRLLTCPDCRWRFPEDPEERLLFFLLLDAKVRSNGRVCPIEILFLQIRQWFKAQPNMIDLYNENIFFMRRERQLKSCGNSQVSHHRPQCVILYCFRLVSTSVSFRHECDH